MKDLFGIACSSLCVLHCVATPLLVAAGIPFAGWALLEGETTHIVLSVVVVLVALISFPFGWRHHRSVLPGAMAIAGVVALLLTRLLSESFELVLTLLAAATFITAHWLNRKMLRRDFAKSLPSVVSVSS